MSEEKELQSKTKMMIVRLFLGALGIHRMMMGYSNWWMVLVSNILCLGGLWALYDLIMIATGSMKMADGRELS